MLALLEGNLFVAGGEPNGAVILAPTLLENGTGYELVVFDADVPLAAERARRVDELIAGGR